MQAIDFHCDTLSRLREAEREGSPQSFSHNDFHIDLDKLKRGGYLSSVLPLLSIWGIGSAALWHRLWSRSISFTGLWTNIPMRSVR